MMPNAFQNQPRNGFEAERGKPTRSMTNPLPQAAVWEGWGPPGYPPKRALIRDSPSRPLLDLIWDHFGSILRSFCYHFGMLLRPFWDHSVPLACASCFCLLRVLLACASCSCLLLVPLPRASSLRLLLVFLASAFCLCLLLVPLSSAACLCTLLAPLASASCFSFRPLVFASCGCPLRVLPRLVIISFRCASPQVCTCILLCRFEMPI